MTLQPYRCATHIAALGIAMVLAACGKAGEADQQIQALCAKDGGVKVYETVKVPKNQFDKWGMPRGKAWNGSHWPSDLDPDYQFLSWSETLQKGDAFKGEVEMNKHIQRIRRQSDQKILGESIVYGRSGGDSFISQFTGGQPSGKICPTPTSSLISNVFIKGE